MKSKRSQKGPKNERREVRIEDLKAILERTKVSALSVADQQQLVAAVDTLAFLTQELESKQVSIERLRRMLFGASTEKTSQVLDEAPPDDDSGTNEATGADDNEASGANDDEKPKAPRKGHGRNGAAAYQGAEKVQVHHGALHGGESCPTCEKGKVYAQLDPAVLVRVTGMAPLGATVYELARLRCNLCGEVFTAASPPGVGDEKYDETAAAMIGMLKYGCGLPFNRLEKLEGDLGIPLPAGTQWEVVERAAKLLEPAFDEHVRQAAQGDVLHNDDTTMKILELSRQSQEDVDAAEASGTTSDEMSNKRTGVFTTGIVSLCDGHTIATFFTGAKHAGENLADMLAQRADELGPPIQMCDALSRNTPTEFETILANCNAHGRRRFVDVVDSFPDECRFVLETLSDVYKTDAVARSEQMSPEKRLRLHQAESGPRMEKLEKWLHAQFIEHKVEPNSGLGEAIKYMTKHWKALTLFLRIPRAPLDNNLCERTLKKAILHRKNALFYKTKAGAKVGDIFMTLIHTAESCGANPFNYLVALQRHHQAVVNTPADWMPWNYSETKTRFASLPVTP